MRKGDGDPVNLEDCEHYYEMYSKAGNEAVHHAVEAASYGNRELPFAVYEVQKFVDELGHRGDDEGSVFSEVYDTAVREAIYARLEAIRADVA